MSSIISLPYKLLWYTIPVIMIIALTGRNHTLDIQYHETYYIFTLPHVGFVVSGLLLLNGWMYYVLRQKTGFFTLNRIHVMLTITLSILIVLYGLFWTSWLKTDYAKFGIAHDITSVLILLLVLSQVWWVFVIGKVIVKSISQRT